MKISVLTLFPNMISSYFDESIMKLAKEKQLFDLQLLNPRDFSQDKHKKVDDTPYGGGAGMVQMPQPWLDCLESVTSLRAERSNPSDIEIIVTSPSGEKFDQRMAQEFSQKKELVILCGRYEGFDQRIRDRATREVSIGDYVLTGGELPALTILDSALRLIPGVLGDDESSKFETHSLVNVLEEFEKFPVTKRELEEFLLETGLKKEDLKEFKLIEYPQYTRPADYHGEKVPEILQSGDHKKIFLWRLKKSIDMSLRAKRSNLGNGIAASQ
jgi:tRNA (guanine37-N1)-methyltransferase